MTRLLLVVCSLILLASLAGKSDNTGHNNVLPFNYNCRNIYVFAAKTTHLDNTAFFADTLGLMCSNKICRWDSLQTAISWVYFSSSSGGNYTLNPVKVNNNSITGIESTNEELFLHPPRDDQYKILQICPYPYLKFPLYIGKEWDWQFEVGDQWCPDKNIKWSGVTTFKSSYKVMDTISIETSFGKTPCYHIHAVSNSIAGASSNDIYYSYKYGIIRLCYLPLDKTKVEFNLVASFNDLNLFKRSPMWSMFQNEWQYPGYHGK